MTKAPAQNGRATPEYTAIGYSVEDGVATIELNRPEALNAWTQEMGHELADAIDRAGRDASVGCVLLAGAGRAFSAGADLKQKRATTPWDEPDLRVALQRLYGPLILAVRRLPKPVVAAVNGAAAGYGCSLALAADYVIAGESAYFLLAFVRIGLVPDGGATAIIPARIGYARAMELAMLGDRLPAPIAQTWGLINDVVEDDALRVRALEVAARLAAGPPETLAAIKDLFNRQLLPQLAAQLDAETEAQYLRGLSPEYAEGVAAFIEKRPADFRAAP